MGPINRPLGLHTPLKSHLTLCEDVLDLYTSPTWMFRWMIPNISFFSGWIFMVKRTKNYCIWPLQLSKINRPGIKLSMLKCWTVSAGGAIQVLKERQKTESHYDVVTIFCSKFKHGRGYFRFLEEIQLATEVSTLMQKKAGKAKKKQIT